MNGCVQDAGNVKEVGWGEKYLVHLLVPVEMLSFKIKINWKIIE